MSHIKLDPQQQPLIHAAIEMGNWMKQCPETNEQARAAIEAIQQTLQSLPTLPDQTLAMYGFSIERGNAEQGLVRGWDVSIEYFADDSEQQGGLELFSSWLPIPESTAPDVLATKREKEVYFHWAIGDVCCYVNNTKAEQWQQQVQQPFAMLEPGDRLRLEIVYQEFYAEIDVAV